MKSARPSEKAGSRASRPRFRITWTVLGATSTPAATASSSERKRTARPFLASARRAVFAVGSPTICLSTSPRTFRTRRADVVKKRQTASGVVLGLGKEVCGDGAGGASADATDDHLRRPGR